MMTCNVFAISDFLCLIVYRYHLLLRILTKRFVIFLFFYPLFLCCYHYCDLFICWLVTFWDIFFHPI